MIITKRQHQIYEYICKYLETHGYSPSLQEIRIHLGLSAISTVHEHVQHMVESRLLEKDPARARSLKPVVHGSLEQREVIPLLGTVAAGEPIEAVEIPESFAMSSLFSSPGETFALKVKGDSMKEDGILEGDIIIVKKKDTADNGETVIALLDDGTVTVKRFYREGKRIRLQPSNPLVPPIIISDRQEIKIQGIVIGLVRKF